MKNDEANKRQ